MPRAVLIAVAALLASTASAEEADEAFYTAAYEACVAALKPHVKATGDKPVEFAPRKEVTGNYGEEFSFSFGAGSILNANFDKPHPVSGMEWPAGSCWGVPGKRTFTRIILNGAVLDVGPVSF